MYFNNLMEAVETIQEYLVDRAQNRNQLVEELFAEAETYLIGRNSVGQNFRWAKLFVGRNFVTKRKIHHFRPTKNFAQ